MMSETITVGDIYAAITHLPHTAPVILEDRYGVKYELTRAFAIGTTTDDPGLVLNIRLVTFRSVE